MTHLGLFRSACHTLQKSGYFEEPVLYEAVRSNLEFRLFTYFNVYGFECLNHKTFKKKLRQLLILF